jgi:hypothetical protein
MVTENEIQRRFLERTTAELTLAQNEVKWWNELVAKGVMSREHAEGNIRNEQRIIETKRRVLGFPG